MARPNKIGLDYFPLDVNIDSDDKIELIEAEFGLKGFGLIIKLLCKIYKDNGYYYKWGDKERLLFAKRSGESGGLVDEIVKRSIKWELFDEDVFNQFQILTSAPIQRRYLDATSRREEVQIISEICLIDINDYSNAINVNINKDNEGINPQSKVKESKVKKSNTPIPPRGQFSKTENLSNSLKTEKRERKKVAPKKERFQFGRELIKIGADEGLVNEWMNIRKAKKAINSEKAFKDFVSEVDKAGIGINEVLAYITDGSRQWRGFKASYLKQNEKVAENANMSLKMTNPNRV